MIAEKGPLNLSGEDYWNEPLTHKGDTGLKRILAEADGMLLDAPPVVDLSKHSTIPVLCHRSGPTEKLFQFNLKTTTQLVVSHLETGDVQLTKLAPSPDRRSDSPPSPGWTTDWLEIDLDEKVDLGPKMGRYAVWIVCGPEGSNMRTINLFTHGQEPHTQDYKDRVTRLNAQGTDLFRPDTAGDYGFRSHTIQPAAPDKQEWDLTPEKGPNGETRIRLRFRVSGLPGFAFPSGKEPVDAQGRTIYAHLPVLVFGFGESRRLSIRSQVDIPVTVNPEGHVAKPILSGDVSFKLPNLNRPESAAEALDLWVTALDRRAHLRIPAMPGK